MRIGIEAQRLFRPHKHGMDRVALELIKNLQKIDKENEYFIFVKPDKDNKVISDTDNFRIVEVKGGAYPIWEQFNLPKVVKTYNCDILHCTGNTAPLSVKTPLITTLHDVIFKEDSILEQLSSSASWYQKVGNLYRRLIVDNIVKRSNQLITVSEFEKQNISNIYGLGDSKIQAIYNGVSANLTADISEAKKVNTKIKYELPEKYFLHFGNTDPRKNTKRVIEAYNKYLKIFKDEVKLVLIGLNQARLNAILKDVGLKKELGRKIVLIGYVPDEDLSVIFNLSEVFLFPSLREGFGIPIIEAMACGVPVITSNTSSMPEVADDAALLVDPYRVASIFEAIVKLRLDREFRDQLIMKGFERYKTFSWENTAKKVLGIYLQFNHKNN